MMGEKALIVSEVLIFVNQCFLIFVSKNGTEIKGGTHLL